MIDLTICSCTTRRHGCISGGQEDSALVPGEGCVGHVQVGTEEFESEVRRCMESMKGDRRWRVKDCEVKY